MSGISHSKLAMTLAASLAFTPLMGTFVVAQDVAETEEIAFNNAAAYRIDIAGRQRMLSQRMAKSICFVELGVDTEAHLASLDSDHTLFTNSLIELVEGGGTRELLPEADARTLAALEIVQDQWTKFNAEVETILQDGTVTSAADERLLEANLALLNAANEAVSLIEQEYTGATSMEMSDAVSVNLYGRQRMLSQKMAKEFCYIAAGHRVEEERAILMETVGLFDASLQAITNGMPAMGIIAPPNDEIAAQLGVVAEVWGPLKAIYDKIGAGADPTQEEIATISAGNLDLLSEMAKAVDLYVSR